jgi:deoxyribodipyrimidine photo-lyase
MTSILWFRQDLRLSDQPAFVAALKDGPVIPVYVLDDETPGDWKIGGAQRWWLHHSLASLVSGLERLGSRLILRRGRCSNELKRLANETGATRVHALRHYEPWWMRAEEEVAAALDLQLHDGNQLAPPAEVRSGSGQAFKVYSPYWRALQQHLPPPEPLPIPERVEPPLSWPDSERLAHWNLLPIRPNWAAEFSDLWR